MADTPSHTHAVVLKMHSPYFKYDTVGKTWSWKFSLSGADLTSAADALTLVTDLWGQVGNLVSPATYLESWLYYKSGELVNSYSGTFTPTEQVGTGECWSPESTASNTEMLDVCAMIRAPMGNNSKGRAYYLRKYVHDVPAQDGGSEGKIPSAISTSMTSVLEALSTGFDSADHIVVDPKTGNAPIGPWVLVPYLVTRQLRKSPKGR